MLPPATTPLPGARSLDLEVGREECRKLELALTREWLETDGLGGFASSTILSCPTRRYHGLLVTTPEGLAKRHLFLAGFDESLHGRSKSFPLSVVRYRGTWHPHGHQSIERFELRPWPCALYRIGGAEVRREVLMTRGRAQVLVRWSISGIDHAVELRLRPLLACREADALTRENVDLDPRVERVAGGIRCRPYDALPPVALSTGASAARFEADPVWYRDLEYQVDLARGYDGHEDLFSPGTFHVRLEPGGTAVVACQLVDPPTEPERAWTRAAEARLRERESASAGPGAPGAPGARSAPVDTGAPVESSLRGRLALAAEQFLYAARTPSGRARLGVIAGYPWFGEWGRDTFISLPGLLLARGRVEECGDALEGALEYLERGLLPNVFGATKAASDYGSADASLWFARAVRLYELAGGARERVQGRFLPALLEIARRYAAGAPLGIRCDDDGLLHAGAPDLNATWMDARVDGVPVTPRHGCAVELNALWYFLLEYLETLAAAPVARDEKGKRGTARDVPRAPARDANGLAARTGAAFLERFWLEDEQRLADVWIDGRADRRVRPNMVIAAALEFSPLTPAQRAGVVRCAEAELLTPRGLRTLGPREADYVGVFAGGTAERDHAYHQGTVWPWLFGFHCEAALRARAPLRGLRALLSGFEEHLFTHGLGQVSEVFDGDPPHRPGGTIAQAWSVAELLRAHALLDEAGA